MSAHDLAQVRASIAAAWDRAESLLVERIEAGTSVPPGFQVWRVGGPGGPMTAMPALSQDAPIEVRDRYLSRVVANCTGRCPMCSAVVSLPVIDPEERPAAWSALPVSMGLHHDVGCPCLFDESEKRWFVPFREEQP